MQNMQSQLDSMKKDSYTPYQPQTNFGYQDEMTQLKETAMQQVLEAPMQRLQVQKMLSSIPEGNNELLSKLRPLDIEMLQ